MAASLVEEEREICVNNIIIDEHLSNYIDERVERLLGHFRKDFDERVSAEKLGLMFGDYGTFVLPLYLSSSQPKVPLQEDTETEEREIFVNNMNQYLSNNIDERVERLLGHFEKDFQERVSTKKLGPMFGDYGTFLHVFLRSSPQPKVPLRPIATQEKLSRPDPIDHSGGVLTRNPSPNYQEDEYDRFGKNSAANKSSSNNPTLIDREKMELLETIVSSPPKKASPGCVRLMSTSSSTVAGGEESPLKLMRRKMKRSKAIRYCIRQPKITKSRYW